MRLTLRIASIVVGLLVCLPLHYLWKLFGRQSPWPRRFLGWAGRSAGMHARVVGVPLRSHVLFVSNHLSWLDILVIAGTSGAAFVSKDDIARWPVIGWLSRLNNTVFVARTERGAVKGQADELRNALARGQPVALFPEGTVSVAGEVLPFRASLFASLFPPLAKVKVQPVAIDYGEASADIAWVEGESIVANARRIFSRRGPMPVMLRFLEPVDPHIYGDRKALAARSRLEIVEALKGSAAGADRL